MASHNVDDCSVDISSNSLYVGGSVNEKITLRTSGTLNLAPQNMTLKDLEDFCKEARALGLGDNTQLLPFRQSIMGPTVGFHFQIPVVPKVNEGG